MLKSQYNCHGQTDDDRLKLPTTKDENPRTRNGGDFHITAMGRP